MGAIRESNYGHHDRHCDQRDDDRDHWRKSPFCPVKLLGDRNVSGIGRRCIEFWFGFFGHVSLLNPEMLDSEMASPRCYTLTAWLNRSIWLDRGQHRLSSAHEPSELTHR